MRLDPKNHTTCANDRHVLAMALDMYINAKKRRLAAIARSSASLDKTRANREQAEMKLARTEDLLKEFLA